MDMKSRGLFMSRSLSFNGAEFEVVEHDLDPVVRKGEIFHFKSRIYRESV